MEEQLEKLGLDISEDEFQELLKELTPTQAEYLDGLLRGDLLWYPLEGPQVGAYLCSADVLFYGGAAGGGKALEVSSNVITPWGFKPIGDLKVGDTICNPDGTHQKVIGVYPQGVQDLYRVKFQDGPSVLATGDHRWLYSGRVKAKREYLHEAEAYPEMFSGKHQGLRLATTAMLVRRFVTAKRFRPRIPLTRPVRFTAPTNRYSLRPEERIDPYVLGLLLGDGSLSGKGIRFTSSDPELIQEVKARTWGEWNQDGERRCWYAVGATRVKLNAALGILGLKGTLSDTKFVPKPFLLANVESRWELLQGLMDSDGYAGQGGRCAFCSTSRRLARHVQWLVRSLGGRARLRVRDNHEYYNPDWDEWRDAKTAYCIHIQVPDKTKLFKLRRKQLRADAPFQGGRTTLKRRIDSIEPAGRGEATCIAVDHPNGLFLTEGFVVTHNSDLILGLGVNAHSKTIVFRREYGQLTELIDRSYAILTPTGAKFNAKLNRWRFIPGNRVVEFGACQREKDKEKFKGRPHDLKAFDEVCDFTESQIRFLIAWNRTTDPRQRCRVIMAGNPPTVAEGDWILRFFAPWLDDTHANPAAPAELRYFAVVEGKDIERENGDTFTFKDEEIQPTSRTFIPARLSDNPYLMATNYSQTLQALPEPLRSQLLYGDFSLGRESRAHQCIPTMRIRLAQQRSDEQPRPAGPMTHLGVDTARGGKDEMVMSPRYGDWYAPLICIPGVQVKDGPTAATFVLEALGEEIDVRINVDITGGCGGSLYDILKGQGLKAFPVNFAEKSFKTDKSGRLKIRNVRAEMYWTLRERLDPTSGRYLILPRDNVLLADLAAPTWKATISGILLDSKDDIRSQLGRSPGRGDALALATYEGATGQFFRGVDDLDDSDNDLE